MQTAQQPKGVVRTPVTIIRLHGKQFVTGLYWQPLSKPRSLLQEAREIGKREGAAFAAIRRGNAIMQAGFVEAGRGAQAGMISLAAVLAAKLGKNWIGVIPLGDDRYFLCATHDGAINPGTDFVGLKDEVHDKFNFTHCMFTWDRVYLPKGFTNIAVGEELDLAKLLSTPDVGRDFKLQPLSFSLTRSQAKTAALVVAGALAIGGGYMYWAAQQRAHLLAEQQRLAAAKEKELAELNAATKLQQTVQALEHPWSKQPAANVLLTACTSVINAFPAILGGWQFESAKCEAKSVVAQYRRLPNASVANIKYSTRQQLQTEAVVGAGYETATITLPVVVSPGGDDALMTIPLRTDSFVSHFQRSMLAVKLSEVPPSAPVVDPLPGGAKAPPPPPPPWTHYTWSFDTEQLPVSVLLGLDMTGIRLTSIEVDMHPDAPAPLHWTLIGDMYANK